jgi:site-specific DNA-methyltransferase (adenine-specific)
VGAEWELRACRNDDPVSGLASLSDRSVDVMCCDPPYEEEAHTKGKRQNPTRDEHVRVVDEAFYFAPITTAERSAVGHEIGRVTKIAVLVFCQVEAAMLWRAVLEAGGLSYRRTIPWVKPDAMPSLHGKWPGQAFEAIVLAMRPGAVVPVGGKSRYYEVTRERGVQRAHPTAKPLELMRQIIEDFTLPGQLVCDPYAGSGTTGVACRMLGRRFLGWEQDPAMAEIARRRIAGDRAVPVDGQMEMF